MMTMMMATRTMDLVTRRKTIKMILIFAIKT